LARGARYLGVERVKLGRFVSEAEIRKLESAARARPESMIRTGPGEFATHYNREAFLFRHDIAGHPLFQLEKLFELCFRLPAEQVKYRIGKIPVDAHFDSSLDRYQGDLSLREAIDRFIENRTYIAIYNPEIDELYRGPIEQIVGDIGHKIGALDSTINWYSTYIFLSTCDSVTPYHMDREMNFLFQIKGRKTAMLWNRFDDRVMSSSQRDALLGNRRVTRPTYNVALDAFAKVFALEEGCGLHHPFIAPHLISTHSECSISLAVTYRTVLSDTWSDAHTCNHFIRKLGLTPSPVGLNTSRDQHKARLAKAGRKLIRPLRFLKHKFAR
jgi:hypothetical protein